MAGGDPLCRCKTGVFCFIRMSFVSSKRVLGVFAGMTDGVDRLSAPGALPEPLSGEFCVISGVYEAVLVKIGL